LSPVIALILDTLRRPRSKVEEMFMTGKTPCPVERTLLTTGLVAAAMHSLASGQEQIPTPHLANAIRCRRSQRFAGDDMRAKRSQDVEEAERQVTSVTMNVPFSIFPFPFSI
jgi:hypothetical protein